MRTRGRVDANQKAIVQALRQCGCSVAIISSVGGGVPDLIVGRNGKNILLELKDGTRKPSERRLTDDEMEFANSWRGCVELVESPEQAVRYVLGNS